MVKGVVFRTVMDYRRGRARTRLIWFAGREKMWHDDDKYFSCAYGCFRLGGEVWEGGTRLAFG